MKTTWKVVIAFVAGVLATALIVLGITGGLLGGKVTPLQLPQTVSDTSLNKMIKQVDELFDSFKDFSDEFNEFTDEFHEYTQVCAFISTGDEERTLTECDSNLPSVVGTPISKGVFAEMLVKKFNLPSGGQELTCSDIDNTDSCYDYLRTLFASQNMEYYSDMTCRSDDTLNRAEAAKIISNTAGLEPVNCDPSLFNDVGSGSWYCDYVTTLFVNTGSNYELFGTTATEKSFDPGKVITNDWVANILNALVKK